jgi:hypothetical protein
MDCNNFIDVFILIAVSKRNPYRFNNVTETTWNIFNMRVRADKYIVGQAQWTAQWSVWSSLGFINIIQK